MLLRWNNTLKLLPKGNQAIHFLGDICEAIKPKCTCETCFTDEWYYCCERLKWGETTK